MDLIRGDAAGCQNQVLFVGQCFLQPLYLLLEFVYRAGVLHPRGVEALGIVSSEKLHSHIERTMNILICTFPTARKSTSQMDGNNIDWISHQRFLVTRLMVYYYQENNHIHSCKFTSLQSAISKYSQIHSLPSST